MAGARSGVHQLQLKPISVPPEMIDGDRVIKWDEDAASFNLCTLKVDPKGYFVYWVDIKKHTKSKDISRIRDTRIGKYARIPRVGAAMLREQVNFIGLSPAAVEERIVSICYGTKFDLVTWHTFAFFSAETAKMWADQLLSFACNLMASNPSKLSSLEKVHTKLTVCSLNEAGQLPIKVIEKMFSNNQGERKRVSKALEKAGIPVSHGIDIVKPVSFPFDTFLMFYHHLVFTSNELNILLAESMPAMKGKDYLTLSTFKDFLNNTQRDPRLNEILYPYATEEKAMEFINKYEDSPQAAARGHLSHAGFLAYLMSEDNLPVPYEKYDLSQEMTHPLSCYFIDSSHNTYLTGHQLKSPSSVEMYRQVLLSGCRCVELDCWDGEDEEPVITHGYTLCTKVLFKDVLEAIAESAFKMSDYPVILSFENHCNKKQQAKMAMYCLQIFGDMLLIDPIKGYPLSPGQELPSPEKLKRKILIKNKKQYSGVTTAESTLSDTSSVSGSEDGDTDESTRQDKGTAFNEEEAGQELSNLVNYITPVHFHTFEVSEKRNKSYEVSSFVETTGIVRLKETPVDFVNYNKRQMSRVYPKGTRVDSSNYTPQVFWSTGCQLVALNFQTLDLPMQLNLGMFEFNARTGYILKPECMRRKDKMFDPFSESIVDGIIAGTVSVRVISGHLLSDKKINTYVEVDMYGLPADTVKRRHKTKSIPNNGINPVYDEEPFVFNKVVLPTLAMIRIAAMEEPGKPVLGHRILPVIGLRPGYRHIQLRNECNQPLTNPSVFVHITVGDYVASEHELFISRIINPLAAERHGEMLKILMDDEGQNNMDSRPLLTPPDTPEPEPPSIGSDNNDRSITEPTSVHPPHTQYNAHYPPSSIVTEEFPSPDKKKKIQQLFQDPKLLQCTPFEELYKHKQVLKYIAKREKESAKLHKKHTKAWNELTKGHTSEIEKLDKDHSTTIKRKEEQHQKARQKASKIGTFKEAKEQCSKDMEALRESQRQEKARVVRKHMNQLESECDAWAALETDCQVEHRRPLEDAIEMVIDAYHYEHMAKITRLEKEQKDDLQKVLEVRYTNAKRDLKAEYTDKDELGRHKREKEKSHIKKSSETWIWLGKLAGVATELVKQKHSFRKEDLRKLCGEKMKEAEANLQMMLNDKKIALRAQLEKSFPGLLTDFTNGVGQQRPGGTNGSRSASLNLKSGSELVAETDERTSM